VKIRQINYDEVEDEQIKDITVTMTFNEAVALVNLAGQLNGHALKRLGLQDGESLYDALDGVFNQHFEDGYPNLHISLESIKEPL
jgi:hypothetical protein